MERRPRSRAALCMTSASICVAAVGVVFAVRQLSSWYFSRGSKAELGLRRREPGSVCILASNANLDTSRVLSDSSVLAIVGYKGMTFSRLDTRLLETETEDGWIHVVKHLQPDTLVVPDIDLASIRANTTLRKYIRNIIAYSDAPALGLAIIKEELPVLV